MSLTIPIVSMCPTRYGAGNTHSYYQTCYYQLPDHTTEPTYPAVDDG